MSRVIGEVGGEVKSYVLARKAGEEGDPFAKAKRWRMG